MTQVAELPVGAIRARNQSPTARTEPDPSGFTDIYEAYYPRVYRYFLTVLHDSQEAEDAAHEVFIKVLRALSRASVTGPGAERWLFRIARNHAIDIRRRPARALADDPEQLARVSEPMGDAERLLSSLRGSEGKILALIAGLPLGQRQVLVLRYLYGLDTEQISSVLGRTAGHVRVLEHRALCALRQSEASGGCDIRAALGSRRWAGPPGRHRLHSFSLLPEDAAMGRLPPMRALQQRFA